MTKQKGNFVRNTELAALFKIQVKSRANEWKRLVVVFKLVKQTQKQKPGTVKLLGRRRSLHKMHLINRN